MPEVQKVVHFADGSEGKIYYQIWTARQRFFRGLKLGLKINAIVLLLALPFALLEPFLFLIWGGLLFIVLFTIVGPLLHWIYYSEEITFHRVDGHCPQCRQFKTFKPYLKTKVSSKMKVHCEDCGQTLAIELNEATA